MHVFVGFSETASFTMRYNETLQLQKFVLVDH